ncbi:MAG: hypothetical protein M5R42_04450 [Rhodocyclaceae bacterium]|nr:hypothetical protein [Rhodocyclaceae bacterium]
MALTDRAHMPESKLDLLCEDLINAHSDDFRMAAVRRASSPRLLCHLAPTATRRGRVYSHRLTVLHAYGLGAARCVNLSARDTVLPVVLLFRIMSTPGALRPMPVLAGAKLVMPGLQLRDGQPA